MTLKYRGEEDNAKHNLKGKRFGEFGYNEDTESDEFFRRVNELEKMGWVVDSSVSGWALVEVENRREFDELMRDWKKTNGR